MKKPALFLLFIPIFITNMATAQQLFPTFEKNSDDPSKFHIQLNEVTVVSERFFANDTDLYRYNQLKHYIGTVMPYVNTAVKLFTEINEVTLSMNRINKKKYIKSREREIRESFEDKLKTLNITQGRLLVKIINRQLTINCFDIIRELKNPVSAAYYQTWAVLNGINLNENYKPENNKDIERILKGMGH